MLVATKYFLSPSYPNAARLSILSALNVDIIVFYVPPSFSPSDDHTAQSLSVHPHAYSMRHAYIYYTRNLPMAFYTPIEKVV